MSSCLLGFIVASSLAMAAEAEPIRLFSGYVTRIRCEGRLLVSAVGNEGSVRLEPLPRELGCGVLIKPVALSGRTNLILETSVGTVERIIEIQSAGHPLPGDLFFSIRGSAR